MSQINVDLKEMLAAGVHFGHYKRRWHPRIAPYIHSVRGGRCIIDLTLTKTALEKALAKITQTVAENKSVLFVGTKRQAQDIVQKAAVSTKMPYVVNRWVGGMLTNHATIQIQVKKLKQLEERLTSGELANKYSKIEVQNFQKEIENLNFMYGGIKEMNHLPALVFIIDMNTNAIAVTEANKLGIPIVAIADTNTDPTLATYPIPANDDALQSLQIITDFVSQAIILGQQQVESPPLPVKKDASDDTLKIASLVAKKYDESDSAKDSNNQTQKEGGSKKEKASHE